MPTHRLRRQSGFTLIEVLIVIAIIGIMVSLSSLGFDMVDKHQLNSAKSQLLADLKKLRVDAVSTATLSTGRGFGIRFISGTTYRFFEFNDIDSNYFYKTDHTEAIVNYETVLAGGATVTIGDSGDATNNIRIYDRRGILRKEDWSSAASQTYVIRHPKIAQAKCIVIDTVTIREGTWNASASTPCQ